MSLNIYQSQMQVGRVVTEDEKFMLLEIAKDQTEPVTLQEGDRFFTLVFVRAIGPQQADIWVPWESES